MNRTLITGIGAVCGSGVGTSAIWEAVAAGRSAIGPIQQWDVSEWPTTVSAELNGVDNRTLVEDRKLHKLISRTDMLGLCAAAEAIKQSQVDAFRQGLDAERAARFNDRSGIFAGSGGGNYKSNYDFFPAMTAAAGKLQAFGQEFSNSVNPMWLLRNLPNNVLCHVGIRHTFKGTNGCITNQCVGGALAITEAAYAVRANEADRVLAVGHDTPIEPETVFHYCQLGLMAPDTVRPFDAQRKGTVFGEGAGAILLESEASAKQRNAPILGEFLGSGTVTEAAGVVDLRPDGDGVRRAIELALADAGLAPKDIGVIVAHGNGTKSSDASEAAGIRAVFGKDLPPVTAFKWAFGHLIAASGILDVIMGLQAVKNKTAPGIPTLNRLDPELSPLAVSSKPQQPRSAIALVLCRGFAAMNVALIVRTASS
jgi:3-oxoacyl-[acyl-carrier-protein] synthase-1